MCDGPGGQLSIVEHFCMNGCDVNVNWGRCIYVSMRCAFNRLSLSRQNIQNHFNVIAQCKNGIWMNTCVALAHTGAIKNMRNTSTVNLIRINIFMYRWTLSIRVSQSFILSSQISACSMVNNHMLNDIYNENQYEQTKVERK